MANTQQLNLIQKFWRFLFIGILVFILAFWGMSSVLIPPADGQRNLTLLRLILKSSIHQPFPAWLHNLESLYVPFFLRQQSLMTCYLIAASLAWLAAFFYDGRILRKENAP
jgi:uncharacterized protein involved in cysteine biosynthesis